MSTAVAMSLTAAPALAAGPTAGTARVGSAPAAQRIAIALPLRSDLAGLSRFATAVSTPGSPQYARYASVAALSRRFGATRADRWQVVRFLRGHGATRVTIDVTGLFADATVTVARAQALFHTSLARFAAERDRSFVAPAAAVHLPAGLRGAVTGVVGLDRRPWDLVRPERARAHPDNVDSAYAARTGTASGCSQGAAGPGFTPNQYLTAYGYSPLQQAGLTGQGERAGLVEIDGFRASDIATFARCFGLQLPPIHTDLRGVKRPLAPGAEATLDLELLDAAAPGLSSIDVYESDPFSADVLNALTSPLRHPARRPNVISASLGDCEADTYPALGRSGLSAAEGALAMEAATGISVMASSGDDGSSDCVSDSGNPVAKLAVNFPASSPWVTSVGGTNFTLNAANQITDQIVWNDAPGQLGAGGGGLSALFARPAYQAAVSASPRRAVPDVSMLADPLPGVQIFCTVSGDCVNRRSPDPWIPIGGTSAASPLLAGGLALVDESLHDQGRAVIGAANPLLYRLAGDSAALYDVTANDNDLGRSIRGAPLGCCTAGPGFDLASGLGTVKVDGLAQAAGTILPAAAHR